jgi:uncharacterized protein
VAVGDGAGAGVPRVDVDDLGAALLGLDDPLEADGMLQPAVLVEDELILALPVVPVSPDAEAVERDFAPTVEEIAQANPFAALSGWKKED